MQALRPDVTPIRVGWLFLAGTPAGGSVVFEPLVSVPVVVRAGGLLGAARLTSAGDAALSARVPPADRRTLYELLELATPDRDEPAGERADALGRLARLGGRALGADVDEIVPAGGSPAELAARAGVRAVAGFAVYGTVAPAAPAAPVAPPAAPWLDPPPFAHLGREGVSSEVVDHALRLDGHQRLAVDRAARAAVSVVTGAAGTGKTTVVAAVAADATRRRSSVLITAPSDGAVDLLARRLLATPGVVPVVFGSSRHRHELMRRLVELRRAPDVGEVAELAVARDRARSAFVRQRRGIERELAAERAWERHDRRRAGAWFAGHTDLDRLRAMVDDATHGHGRTRRRAARHLARHAGGRVPGGLPELVAAAEAAIAGAGADVLDAIGGVDLTESWERLVDLERHARDELARWAQADVGDHDGHLRSRLAVLRTIGEVLRALPGDRSTRRIQFDQIATSRLTGLLPVWLGTVEDALDLLPDRAGMFDLVVVDDATELDAAAAEAVIRRGRRLLVLGDPVRTRPGVDLLTAVADRGGAEATALGALHRRRAGVGRDRAPAVPAGPPARVGPELRRVEGDAVAAVVDAVVRAGRAGAAGVGVVVPDDAIPAVEAALVDAFVVEQLAAWGVVVGRADQLRHREVDVVVADLTGEVDPWDAARFDASVAAARKRIVVLHRGGSPERPGPACAAGDGNPWTATVAATLVALGHRVEPGRRAGRHVVDVALPDAGVAVLTTIHPDGPAEHVERHLDLVAAGWDVVDVLASRWARRRDGLPAALARWV